MKLESLEELRVFSQIVESGSLTAAARALGMAPNTVSRRLASLEERLDTQLLYRTTRSMSLSEPGRALLGRARRILEQVEAAETALQTESERLTGLVRISVPSVLSADLLASLQPLLRDNPGLRLDVQVHDRLVNPVTEGLDVVVMGGRLSDSSLVARKLLDVAPVLVASATYLSEHGAPRTPQDLHHHKSVRFTSDQPQTSWVLRDAQGTEHVVPITSQVEANDGRALLDAVRAGIGIGLTSPRVLRHEPTLQRVLPGYHLTPFPVYAIYPATRQRSARLLAVVDALQRALGLTQ